MKNARSWLFVVAVSFSSVTFASGLGAERCVGTEEDVNACIETGRYRVVPDDPIERCVYTGGPTCTPVTVPTYRVNRDQDPDVDLECNRHPLADNCIGLK